MKPTASNHSFTSLYTNAHIRWLALGMAFGGAVGAAFGHFSVGVTFGMIAGLAIAFRRR